MADLRTYPNGYVGRGTGLGIQGDADLEMTVLYQDYMARRSAWNWEHQRPYFEAALRLFGCPVWFLERQLRQPGLCKYRRQYVLDTLEFIRTGYRPTAVYSLTSVFDYKSDSLPLKADPSGLPLGVECIARWVSQEGGFADLVESMAVFFGPKSPVAGV